MEWLAGHAASLGSVVAKAVLMYAAALLVLRVGERRTVAQMAPIDFAVAVALGALIGRTATASTTSWAMGATAMGTLIVAHRAVTLARMHGRFARLVDHRIRVLVVHGQLRRRELRLCGLTTEDVLSQLREHGVRNLADVRFALYETKGRITVVREDDAADGDLVQAALASAADPAR